MKPSKFSLADVLTVLTAVSYGYICFLGQNFLTMGNTFKSIIVALIITVALTCTAFAAKLLKRTSHQNKTSFILEGGAILLFSILMVFFSYYSFPHYFNVTERKEEIQSELQKSITQAEDMFNEYEAYVQRRVGRYQENLQNTITFGNPEELRKYRFIDPNQMPFNRQVAHKIKNLKDELFPSHYSDTVNKKGIKEAATLWLERAHNFTEKWRPIGIVNIVNDVEVNSNNWLTQLITFSQVREDGVNDVFPYSLKVWEVKTYFTESGGPTRLSFALSAAAYLLMLFSWIIAKRHSRGAGMLGILKTAPYEVVL
jgi:hypothetical protein